MITFSQERKVITILIGLLLTSIFIIDYSGWLTNVTTTALIFVSENGKDDQNRTGMILVSLASVSLHSLCSLYFMSG